jgi:uncharacterized protein
MNTNALANETSPYLLQHAHNPVNWLPWGEAAFKAARDRDVPILLSVGYSACHWCHVMERESFENLEIAGLMNEHFVPIKVDREERPDVDSIYMNAVQIMTGAGGWPMTVFLTPKGQPFYGGTYYPPEDRYGRPGFKRILLALHDAWINKRDDVFESAKDLTGHLNNFANLRPSETVDSSAPDQALQTLERVFDQTWGGFGDAPKFPNPGNLEFLLEHHVRTGNPSALAMLERTLQRMSAGGMYDHLGGGFARYSTDERWLVPHFEKMLYDNAQLLKLLIQGYQVTQNGDFFFTAKETLEYLLREMRSPEGGFYSAQDADSEGVEGKFFVWDEAEIDAILEENAAVFKRAYGVTTQGNWEHKNVLWRVISDQELDQEFELPEYESVLMNESSRLKLFFAREKRIKPGLDDKILASWNGLLLEAVALYARAARRGEKALAVARQLAQFLLERMSYRDDAGRLRLWHTYKNGIAKVPGLLEDYALVATGMLELYRTTFEPAHLEAAQDLVRTVLEVFPDENGGFFDTPSDGETLIVRPKSYFDSAMPSGNGAMSVLLIKLARLTSSPDLEDTALAAIKHMLEVMKQQPTGFGSLNRALEHHLAPHREIAVVGDLNRDDTKAMLRVINNQYLPHVAIAAGQANLPVLEGRASSEPRVFICENLACQMPIDDVNGLEERLKELRGTRA